MSGRGIPGSPEPADSYRCQVTNTHRSSLASRPQTGRLPMSATGERWSACVPPPGAADRMLAQAGPVEGLPRPPLALHCSVHCKPNKHANTADAAHPGRGPSRVPRSGALARPPASAVRHGIAGATTILSRSAAGPSAGAGMPPPLPPAPSCGGDVAVHSCRTPPCPLQTTGSGRASRCTLLRP